VEAMAPLTAKVIEVSYGVVDRGVKFITGKSTLDHVVEKGDPLLKTVEGHLGISREVTTFTAGLMLDMLEVLPGGVGKGLKSVGTAAKTASRAAAKTTVRVAENIPFPKKAAQAVTKEGKIYITYIKEHPSGKIYVGRTSGAGDIN